MEQLQKPTEEQLRKVVLRARHRGFVNAMFDSVALAFEKENPDLKCIWEYSPPDSKDQFEVRSRELIGYRIVNVDEIPKDVPTPHTQENGPVRVADSVLMCAPKEIHEAYYAEQHRIALEDAQLPAKEYKASLKARGSVGGSEGSAYGDVKEATTMSQVDLSKVYEGGEEK